MPKQRQKKKHGNGKPNRQQKQNQNQKQKQKQMRLDVKDRLFRYLFEKDREALLDLYNALNGTVYRDASQLEIVTIQSS